MRPYSLLAGLLLTATMPALAQQTPGWQLGLRLAHTTTPWQQRGAAALPGVSYRGPSTGRLVPALVVQRTFAGGWLARASLNRLALSTSVVFRAHRADTTWSYRSGPRAYTTVLRLEAGRSWPLSADGRTRLLGAAGLGVLLARSSNRQYTGPTDSLNLPPDRHTWGTTTQSLTRLHKVNGLLSLRLGLTRELRRHNVLSLEVAHHVGLGRVYRTTNEVELFVPGGPLRPSATYDTRASFTEVSLGYHWQLQKKKLGLTAYEPTPGREPWQPLPVRGLYLAAGSRMGVGLARQQRVGSAPLSTVANVALPVFSARLGYQWASGWLAEAGPQTAWVPFFFDFDPTAAAPATRGPRDVSRFTVAPQHTTELSGFPANTAWALLGGHRWALVPDRLYAAAKAGAVLHHYTGPESYGERITLMASTPADDYSEFSVSYYVPRRWRLLVQAEGEIEARISRRTLLGLQLAYAARPVGLSGADQLTVSWYHNGAEQVPVRAYSRMASVTAGVQLRRVLHL
ncbi:hypothetical protein LJ737_03360 [Hymenobacter sp. 15J16-1T3B]|uniref:hypothetical protein n=1 Tax=Hymenobacter sp. 15J16-1T3B TaxID=2886941 RepID=UPI001D12CEE8|nr:hypothetical protein [Hymenobacter sp. 15J16-1T3B]MCC3156257.1 hypothetical protein [Hymenobacter sp. 15J16-1T3B]